MRQPPTPDSAAATRVSNDGCGHIISVTAMGPKDNVPESVACQLPLPRLQSSRKAAWPSAPNVTVNVEGPSTGVGPSAESMLTNCHSVSVSGVGSAAAIAQVASARPAARVTSNVFTRPPYGRIFRRWQRQPHHGWGSSAPACPGCAWQ